MEKANDKITLDKILNNVPDLICCIDKEGRFVRVGGACREILGYESIELEGKPYIEYVLQEDRTNTLLVAQSIMSGCKTQGFENRYKQKGGEVSNMVWSAVWSEEENLMFCTARRAATSSDFVLKEEDCGQWFHALYDKSPDVVFYESKEGLVTYANSTCRKVFGLDPNAPLKLSACAFLSPEMASVNNLSLQEALLGGTMQFDLIVTKPNEKKRVFDIIKSPVKVSGNFIGAQTIGKDITPIVESYETIERQAKRLNTIFESITDAFFTLNKDMVYTYVNSEFLRITESGKHEYVGKHLLDMTGNGPQGIFYQQYRHALDTGESVHFEGYAKKFKKWVDVKAFPSEEGLSVYFTDISEKVRYRKELEKLSMVASNTTNGVIITDRVRRIEWVNEGFSKLTGYSLDEARGKTPLELLFHPKMDIVAYQKSLDKIKSGTPTSFEILNQKKNGEDIWVTVQVNPIYDETGQIERYVSIQTDVTELLESKRELEKLSLVASKANNSVLIADKDWNIEWCNEGFTRLMGYSLQETIGKKPSELLSNNRTDRWAYDSLEEKLLGGEPISFEVLNFKKTGEEVWVNVEINPIFDEKGEICRFIEVQTDVTTLKTTQLELSTIAKDLYSQNSDLQQFTYIISHNLRAPVANIMGLTDLLTTTSKTSETFDYSLTYLNDVAQRLDTVLRDMNEILSIRDSKETLGREHVEIYPVIQQAMANFQEVIETTKAQVAMHVPAGLSALANKAYLYSIFYNLLSNSLKYKSSDRPLTININCFGNAEKGTVISFSDNGSGFDFNWAKENLFKMYKRYHKTQQGRGMGLYLVKNHVEAMGGHIEANSEIGLGTRFLIYLPEAKN